MVSFISSTPFLQNPEEFKNQLKYLSEPYLKSFFKNYLIVNKNGHLKNVKFFQFFLEKIKGILGFHDGTHSYLVKYKTLEFLLRGRRWAQSPECSVQIKSLAQRAGIIPIPNNATEPLKNLFQDIGKTLNTTKSYHNDDDEICDSLLSRFRIYYDKELTPFSDITSLFNRQIKNQETNEEQEEIDELIEKKIQIKVEASPEDSFAQDASTLQASWIDRLKSISGKAVKKLSSPDFFNKEWKTAGIIAGLSLIIILAATSTQNSIPPVLTNTGTETNLTSTIPPPIFPSNSPFPTCPSYEALKNMYEDLEQRHYKDLTREINLNRNLNQALADEIDLKEICNKNLAHDINCSNASQNQVEFFKNTTEVAKLQSLIIGIAGTAMGITGLIIMTVYCERIKD